MSAVGARLWVFSDLHQDCPKNAWDPASHESAGGFDVAVVAGDVQRFGYRAHAPKRATQLPGELVRDRLMPH